MAVAAAGTPGAGVVGAAAVSAAVGAGVAGGGDGGRGNGHLARSRGRQQVVLGPQPGRHQGGHDHDGNGALDQARGQRFEQALGPARDGAVFDDAVDVVGAERLGGGDHAQGIVGGAGRKAEVGDDIVGLALIEAVGGGLGEKQAGLGVVDGAAVGDALDHLLEAALLELGDQFGGPLGNHLVFAGLGHQHGRGVVGELAAGFEGVQHQLEAFLAFLVDAELPVVALGSLGGLDLALGLHFLADLLHDLLGLGLADAVLGGELHQLPARDDVQVVVGHGGAHEDAELVAGVEFVAALGALQFLAVDPAAGGVLDDLAGAVQHGEQLDRLGAVSRRVLPLAQRLGALQDRRVDDLFVGNVAPDPQQQEVIDRLVGAQRHGVAQGLADVDGQ